MPGNGGGAAFCDPRKWLFRALLFLRSQDKTPCGRKPAGEIGGGGVSYAILNQEQATLLLTDMRNSEVVRDLKKRLASRPRRSDRRRAVVRNIRQRYSVPGGRLRRLHRLK